VNRIVGRIPSSTEGIERCGSHAVGMLTTSYTVFSAAKDFDLSVSWWFASCPENAIHCEQLRRRNARMNKNPLLQIRHCGQSIWLDFISRGIIGSGKLQQLIDEDGLRGVTSNPAIFEKAIAGSDDYSPAILALSREGKSAGEIYEVLAVEDIQRAADEFRPVYDRLDGRDGFVSLEVSPLLARDTDATVDEARRLWNALDRPNVLIKVPATKEGLPAIRKLIGEGINVNVTLLFSLNRYGEVADAYLSGLEEADRSGRALGTIASVASFFLSRIDVLVDPILTRVMASGRDKAETARALVGETAIASAKIAYRMYKKIYASDRWRRLADKGGRTQRLLWASTSTKNPDYPDVKYVEPLIGPDTVNTLPMETVDAYRDHGNPEARLEQNLDRAQEVLDTLPEIGIDLKDVCRQLEDEGVEKFATPFNKLLAALNEKSREAR
jgi:transaldolase